jgi:hypothetical protein
MLNFFIRHVVRSGLFALALVYAGLSAPLVAIAPTPAKAQVTEEFHDALAAYGRWIVHAPYGEVWVPDAVPPGWRPYSFGHWVYTDDWGWYWISDESEDDWGWIVYHYGRWAFDRRIGWFWVPGDEWAPAWVDWRYGGDAIGWAPLPPDDLLDVYDDAPDYWVFVPMRYIAEPRVRVYFVPPERRVVLLRSTYVVNRPVHIRDRRIWVNPGLAPGFIAARAHVTLHAYEVRPRVLSGTANVQGAITVRREDLRERGAARRIAPVEVRRTNVAIQPAAAVPPPQPLNKREPGRLGPRPPRAAQGTNVQPGGSTVTQPSPQQPQQPHVQPQQPPSQPQVQPQPPQAPKPPQPQQRVQPQPQPHVQPPQAPSQPQPRVQPQPPQAPKPQQPHVQPPPQPPQPQIQQRERLEPQRRPQESPQPHPQPPPQPQPRTVQPPHAPPPQPQQRAVQPPHAPPPQATPHAPPRQPPAQPKKPEEKGPEPR